MNYIDNYFRNKTKDLTFIELKEDSHIDLNGYKLGQIPLPILVDKFIKEIQEGNLEKEINLKDTIDGIIYTMGIDYEFPHIEEYKNILLAYDKNIKDYILYKAMKELEVGDMDNSCINFRTLLILDPENIKGLFNYAIALEEIGKMHLNKNKVEEGETFIKFATIQLEKILDIDEGFSLVYYKLGYHYKYFQQYVKADLIWQKFFQLSKDEVLLQEIRDEVSSIKDEVNFETGLTYLTYSKYEKALDSFLKLLPKHKESWNVNYLIGQAYMGVGYDDLAIEYISKAIEANSENPDLYNELGIIYFNTGAVPKAIDVFSDGIQKCPKDYKLFFNRGLSYVQLGLYEDGLKDVNMAYDINPDGEGIIEQKQELEKLIGL